MKFTFVGYRYVGGPAWPPFNGVLECSDEEAAKHVENGNAVYLEDEPEPIDPSGFHPLHKWTDDYEPALDPENYRHEDPELSEYEADEEVAEPGPKRPSTAAKKDDWIKYAIAMGEDQAVAERMTRIDLISKYGASL
jgi:hypothetical protein